MSINATAEKICSTRDTVAYELTTCQFLMFPLLKSSKQKSLPSWRKFLRRQKSSLLIWSSMLLIWCPTGKSARCSVNWRRRGGSKKKNSAAQTITWRRKSSSGKPSKHSFSYTNNEFSSRSVKCSNPWWFFGFLSRLSIQQSRDICGVSDQVLQSR